MNIPGYSSTPRSVVDLSARRYACAAHRRRTPIPSWPTTWIILSSSGVPHHTAGGCASGSTMAGSSVMLKSA